MKTIAKVQTYASGLKALRDQLNTALPAEALQVFDQDADQLQRNYSSGLILKEGDVAPDFELTNATGESIRLYRILEDHRVVLTFYRGGWCPYCNLQLKHYQSALASFEAYGAKLVAVSPELPDKSLSTKEVNELQFQVLSDPGNQVSRQYVRVFRNSDKAVGAMGDLGIRFHDFYADTSQELPVPGIFVIEKDQTISFARSFGGDYRSRIEAEEIVESLKKFGHGA